MKICVHVIYLGIPKMGMKKSNGEVEWGREAREKGKPVRWFTRVNKQLDSCLVGTSEGLCGRRSCSGNLPPNPLAHVLKDAPGAVTPVGNQPAHARAKLKPENDLHACWHEPRLCVDLREAVWVGVWVPATKPSG